jgi:hypothetical protein
MIQDHRVRKQVAVSKLGGKKENCYGVVVEHSHSIKLDIPRGEERASLCVRSVVTGCDYRMSG